MTKTLKPRQPSGHDLVCAMDKFNGARARSMFPAWFGHTDTQEVEKRVAAARRMHARAKKQCSPAASSCSANKKASKLPSSSGKPKSKSKKTNGKCKSKLFAMFRRKNKMDQGTDEMLKDQGNREFELLTGTDDQMLKDKGNHRELELDEDTGKMLQDQGIVDQHVPLASNFGQHDLLAGTTVDDSELNAGTSGGQNELNLGIYRESEFNQEMGELEAFKPGIEPAAELAPLRLFETPHPAATRSPSTLGSASAMSVASEVGILPVPHHAQQKQAVTRRASLIPVELVMYGEVLLVQQDKKAGSWAASHVVARFGPRLIHFTGQDGGHVFIEPIGRFTSSRDHFGADLRRTRAVSLPKPIPLPQIESTARSLKRSYNLLTSNCGHYALDLLESVGVPLGDQLSRADFGLAGATI